MSQIVFKPPSKDTPGFLRRTRTALELMESIKENPSPQSLDEVVVFLLPYISEPEDRDQAEELLWDASQKQFEDMLLAITGGDGEENPT